MLKRKTDSLKNTPVFDEAVESSVAGLLSEQKNIPFVLYRRRERSDYPTEGENLSSLKGQGMAFEEVRPYQAGDDIRRIDWRVTAKQGRPYTKLFRQEKERPVFILADLREEMKFGTFGSFKSVLAAKVATFLSFLFYGRKEKTGMVLVSSEKADYFKPRRDKASVLSLIAALSRATRLRESLFLRGGVLPLKKREDSGFFSRGWKKYFGAFTTTKRKVFTEEGEKAPSFRQAGLNVKMGKDDLFLKGVLNLSRLASPGMAVFIISDFHDMDEKLEKAILKLASKCDVSLVHISDALENRLPESGGYFLTDKKDVLFVDMKDKKFQDGYLDYFRRRREYLFHLCRKEGIKLLFLRTDEAYGPLLSRFLRKGVF